jgi:hypothetical protein
LRKRVAAAHPPVALVKIGGGSERDTIWNAALPNPFLTADLRAILERIARERLLQAG